MPEKYRPSNGSEGCGFTQHFCEHCVHEKWSHTQRDGDKQCDIMNRSFLHDIDDPEYPVEWQYDENDRPTCTAWKKWNWGPDEDGKLIEPEEIFNDPNQLTFPFL